MPTARGVRTASHTERHPHVVDGWGVVIGYNLTEGTENE